MEIRESNGYKRRRGLFLFMHHDFVYDPSYLNLLLNDIFSLCLTFVYLLHKLYLKKSNWLRIMKRSILNYKCPWNVL